MTRRDNTSPHRIEVIDHTASNGATVAPAQHPSLVVARDWWPFVKTVALIIGAVAAFAWAAAFAFAGKASKADVDQRIDERIEARAATTDKVKEMIHDLSPYNADRATVQALPAKLDAILNALSAVREDVGVVKETVKQIEKRIERRSKQ